jgi:RimJ/RimL family protein N-acetyltransferase
MNSDQGQQERGFADGEHVVLRPVLEADLAELAPLMAENPLETLPWTHQRLKKKFEDKDEPGLWGKSQRYFAIVRKTGGVVGYLKEQQDANRGMYWNEHHVKDGIADRATLGLDAVNAYLEYKRKWHNPLRISFDVLRPEQEKIAWLEQAGFEHELTQERVMLYLGQPEARCMYTWFSAELLNAPAWEEEETGG